VIWPDNETRAVPFPLTRSSSTLKPSSCRRRWGRNYAIQGPGESLFIAVLPFGAKAFACAKGKQRQISSSPPKTGTVYCVCGVENERRGGGCFPPVYWPAAAATSYTCACCLILLSGLFPASPRSYLEGVSITAAGHVPRKLTSPLNFCYF
jgi:hypothetical protein